jgi:hypothetical protein
MRKASSVEFVKDGNNFLLVADAGEGPTLVMAFSETGLLKLRAKLEDFLMIHQIFPEGGDESPEVEDDQDE